MLGQSGLRVSKYALGCWPFAGGSFWGDQDDATSIATVHAALDAGINFFDTAEAYKAGTSEHILGQALVGRRDQAIIATKVAPNHLTAAEVVTACERSLGYLQTNYIDLYLIHWPNWKVPWTKLWARWKSSRRRTKFAPSACATLACRTLPTS